MTKGFYLFFQEPERLPLRDGALHLRGPSGRWAWAPPPSRRLIQIPGLGVR